MVFFEVYFCRLLLLFGNIIPGTLYNSLVLVNLELSEA